MKPKYSGPKSLKFWARVNALTDPEHTLVYMAGCALQDHEGRVLRMLQVAEQPEVHMAEEVTK